MTPTTDLIAALIEQGYTMGDDGTLRPPVDTYEDMDAAQHAWVHHDGGYEESILAALPHIPIARLQKHLTDEQKRGLMPGRDLTAVDLRCGMTVAAMVKHLNAIARGRG